MPGGSAEDSASGEEDTDVWVAIPLSWRGERLRGGLEVKHFRLGPGKNPDSKWKEQGQQGESHEGWHGCALRSGESVAW
jgi:hypothetical protein